MLFVDTGGWYARTVPIDPYHAKVAQAFVDVSEPLFTTDYIVDELLTLLRVRGEGRRAIEIGRHFFEGSIARVHKISEAELYEAWNVFSNFKDKGWSFTDCTSKVIIESYKITTAISLDRHFSQFGNLTVLP
jgi:predicted nucleic acid-binding protein